MHSRLLVVSLEQAVAAPLCSRKLVDFGARVIKIERQGGDFARHYDRVVNGQSTYFVWLNRGKESVCLDLRQEQDRLMLDNLVSRADVFVQNLRPHSLGSLGIDLGAWRDRHPSLITCSISGYGEEGPYSQRKAYDLLVQAECGLASITGSPLEPSRVGISIVDIAGGVTAYEAILEALVRRAYTGKGDHIDVSLFDSIAEWMTVPLLHARYGDAPERVGLRHPNIAPYGVFTCLDGQQILLSVQNEPEWQALCRIVLEAPELASDGRYLDNSSRIARRDEVDGLVQAAIGTMTVADARARLDKANVAFGLINDPVAVLRHPQLRYVEVPMSTGMASVPAPAARHQSFTSPIGGVPDLNQHFDSVRREFGALRSADDP